MQRPSPSGPLHIVGTALAACGLLGAPDASAHGYAGARFFPATIGTDDPFVADELSLPTASFIVAPGEDGPPTEVTAVSADLSKRITPWLGLGIGGSWLHVKTRGPAAAADSGFSNLEVGAKLEAFRSDPHELLVSLGVDAEVGGTGSARVGAEPFSTISPAVLAGKGLGDLPDRAWLLRPFALTGVLGVELPTEAETTSDTGDVDRHPHVLATGVALEYSLPYLQANVRDVGLRSPWSRLIPLVELRLETALDRGEAGLTTGTVQPGLLWCGTIFQVGVEAVIPVSDRSGRDAGVVAQLHFYLDDLFPHSVGEPPLGGR